MRFCRRSTFVACPAGDFQEALEALLGKDASGLSAQAIGRLKAEWEAEHERWRRRDLSARRYVYMWADGIYLQGRLEDEKQCILVLIGATPEGRKELVGFQAGVRESAQSWRELLACLRGRGLTIGPELAIGDGALGFWKALEEIFPDTRRQRCWVHKTANVLNKLAKSRQTAAKAALHDIWMADGRAEAERAMNTFAAKYDAKYPPSRRLLDKGPRRLAGLLRLPGRALAAYQDDQSNRKRLRYRPPPHRAHQGLLVSRDNSGHGLQADHHRQQDLAAAHGKQSVAQGHRRCEIQRRYADRRNQNSRRRLITPSPKIGHNSYVSVYAVVTSGVIGGSCECPVSNRLHGPAHRSELPQQRAGPHDLGAERLHPSVQLRVGGVDQRRRPIRAFVHKFHDSIIRSIPAAMPSVNHDDALG